MNWELRKLSEIVTISKGEAITKSSENEGPFPVILGGQEPAYYIDRYNHEGEAIVISRSGASAGYASFWNEPIFITDGYLVEPIAGNHRKYVYYLLKHFGKALRDLQNGAAIPHVTPKTIYNLKAPIPPLTIQQRIAGTLSAYDELIEVNNKRIKVLAQMAENLYKEWFVRFRFPGHETAEFENGIPKGWTTKTLNEWMIDCFNGGWGEEIATPKTPNEAAVIRGTDIGDVKASSYCNVPIRYHKENDIKTKTLKENDIVLELSNGNINNIGRTLIITRDILAHFDKVICASFCKTLRFADSNTAFFVWKYIDYLQNSGLLSFYKNTGANGINNFNFKRFLRMPISVPNDFQQLEALLKIDNEISTIREQIFNLKKQRDLLLPRLMSGKLEV